MKKIYSLLILVLWMVTSCNKDLPDIGGTSAQAIANEWWVTLDKGSIQDVYGIGHFKLATYNTAGNRDSIWIDDFKNGWQIKFKAAADFKSQTFQATASPNLYYPITVNVTEGKVLSKVGHSKSGNVVDSIYMKIEFSDDPGTLYQLNGTARTNFIEDEY